MRRALAVVGWLALTWGTAAPAQTPVDARTQLERLNTALDAEDVPAAKTLLEALEARAGRPLDALKYYEGRIAFDEGRYADAVKDYQAAGQEDTPGSYLRLAQDTLHIVSKDAHAESEHFEIFYAPGKDEVLVPYALETLESIHAALEKDLGYAPPGKIRVEVVGNAAELAQVSTLTREEIETTGTIAICKFRKLMVTSPKATVFGYEWRDTLAHEYTHLVITQKSHNTVPIWLQEAFAKYLETRWRGPAGGAMPPSSRSLLSTRVKENRLVPFAKMHPSMAKLPTQEDAITAFAEVFFAADYLHQEGGMAALRKVVEGMAAGKTDAQAVEAATGKSFAAWEKGWMAHIRAQPVPRELVLPSDQKIALKGVGKEEAREDKGKEMSFGDFREVQEAPVRRYAHLGELLRERERVAAASEELGKAHALSGDKYPSISNKYALTLIALRRLDEAERVLQGSLRLHPQTAQTEVHLGRIYLARRDFPRAQAAYTEALAVDPFDPEIHLALLRTAGALGNSALERRARAAAVKLTGLKPEDINAVAERLSPPGPGAEEAHAPAADEPASDGDAGAVAPEPN